MHRSLYFEKGVFASHIQSSVFADMLDETDKQLWVKALGSKWNTHSCPCRPAPVNLTLRSNWESWEKNEFLLFDYLIKQVNTMFFRHLHKRTNLDWWFFLKSPCVLMRGENNVFKQKLIWEDSKCFCWWIETEGTLFIVFDNRFRWQYAFTVKLKNWNETQIISSRHAGVY